MRYFLPRTLTLIMVLIASASAEETVTYTYSGWSCGTLETQFFGPGAVSIGRGALYRRLLRDCKSQYGKLAVPDETSFRAKSCESTSQGAKTTFAYSCWVNGATPGSGPQVEVAYSTDNLCGDLSEKTRPGSVSLGRGDVYDWTLVECLKRGYKNVTPDSAWTVSCVDRDYGNSMSGAHIVYAMTCE